ncbi:MAG: sugar phosphate isomerase/epimerase [Methanobrevibacter sp.]|jgi:sugar phosphate isomerase/epimerase|nr:sugar phosphate isomerase/epimerase [Candidatus Methanovirga meridionalis]
MKIGFSSLALFMRPLKEIFKIANEDGFEIVELLCEGPYWSRYVLENQKEINLDEIREIAISYNIEIFLHAPTIDLNPASMNRGIREETQKQTIETLKLADILSAKAITTHPGIVHRKEKRIRDLAVGYAIETLQPCQKYAEEIGVILSIENMPKRFSYLAHSPKEHEKIVKAVGSSATIDWGHANTYENPNEFLNIPNIIYYHLNDNLNIKDQHLPLGEGNADFSNYFLKKVKYGIIELNNYENVLKSKNFLIKQLGV